MANKKKAELLANHRKENKEKKQAMQVKRLEGAIAEKQRLAARSAQQVAADDEARRVKLAAKKKTRTDKLQREFEQLQPGRAGFGRVRAPSTASLESQIDRY